MSDFYEFLPAYKNGAIKVKPIDGYSGDIFDFEEPNISLNKVMISKGKYANDLVTFSDGLRFCVSEKFTQIVDANCLSGLFFFPLEVIGSDTKLFGLKFLSIIKSTISSDSPNETEFLHSEWEGKDFFLSWGTECCTARAKEILEKAKVSNIKFNDNVRVVIG
jgi:hypothetical protein